jgi:ABC-2 type transport system ATP-binding protein/lipopolysaccharide transport system ATP-binding protein
MSATAIDAADLGKRYSRAANAASYGTLRDALSTLAMRRRPASHEFWALRHLDLCVDEGEAVGIVGRNGAGKTTLLRLLARITEPTTGLARIRGRVGALLEVGTGFHPELNGRENVYLSGAVMGMSRRDIRRRFDEIVSFADVADFLETPLKRFSSGMRLRLAFAVAAHLEPDVLLVDEILAVGDIEFQRRCLQRMSGLRTEGRTVVFVSHDLGAVTRLCSRGLWIDGGTLLREGAAADVVQSYYASALTGAGRVDLPVEGPVGIASVGVTDAEGGPLATPRRDQRIWIEVRIIARRRVSALDLAISLADTRGHRILDEVWSDQPDRPELAAEAGEHVVRLALPRLLRAGDHVVGVRFGTEYETYVEAEALTFTVLPLPEDPGHFAARSRLIQPRVAWSSRRVSG